MAALTDSPDPTTIEGKRDRAILAVRCDTGVRARELCCLRIRDLSPTLAFIRNGKGGKQRLVPLSSRVVLAIKTYLVVHPREPDDRERPRTAPAGR
ncbi:MAG: tyrosine-type recombinase/integrase [Candidatus Riflebacteria bacterium]|nr:tyrosine-type recombinase/integrase [Candidatus Riflebacteria bacterium]